MAHITRQVARDLIVELRLPQVVLDIFDGHPPEDLRYLFGCPEEYFGLNEKQQAYYGADVVVPFLDDGHFANLFAYHRQKRAFLRFLVETPSTAAILDAPTYSWQQLMARQLLRFHEYEMTQDQLRSIARQLDFHFVDELITLIERDASDDYDTWLARCDEFIASVGAWEARK